MESRTAAPIITRTLTSASEDRGSLQLGPLSGFALYLGMGIVLSRIPTVGPFIVAGITMFIAIAFVVRTIRDDKRLNADFADAWWATQPTPLRRTDEALSGRWSR